MDIDVTFLLYDGVAGTDVVGPADVLTCASAASSQGGYRINYVGNRTEVTASNGMVFKVAHLSQPTAQVAHTIFIPGADEAPLRAALGDETLLSWLRASSKNAQRVCSICSGAFLLAQAGLLKDTRATTHWRGIDQLEQWRDVRAVERDALFVEDGRIWTSAGVTAGIDMTLELVARDLGHATAIAAAREMVLYLVRPGSQAQFSEPLNLQARAQHSDLRELPPWLDAHLSQRVTVAMMAEGMRMTERTLHRRCVEVFALTPLALLQQLRLERARLLLADKSVPLKSVAQQSGFTDVSVLGKTFKARFGISPSEYRTRFGH